MVAINLILSQNSHKCNSIMLEGIKRYKRSGRDREDESVVLCNDWRQPTGKGTVTKNGSIDNYFSIMDMLPCSPGLLYKSSLY